MKILRLSLISLMTCLLFSFLIIAVSPVPAKFPAAQAQDKPGKKPKKKKPNTTDGRNRKTGKKPVVKDPGLAKYAIYQKTAPRPQRAAAVETSLPLNISKGSRIAFIGNTLFDRAQDFAYFEAFLHQHLPDHELEVRNLTWSADSIEAQPRPANFADSEQHLTLAKADIIFAAYGFNESFAGKAGIEDFRKKLAQYVADLKTKAFNGKTAARIVLVSPIANENIKGVHAADLNNPNIKLYTAVIQQVASSQDVGYANTYSATEAAMTSPGDDLTINGAHLNARGYEVFSEALFKQVIGRNPPAVNETLRQAVIEKNKQFFYRYRPVNTFYYTGGRNRSYGYLDFLPAMRNFDIMVANRDKRIWALARGKKVPKEIDDSNVPPLPQTTQSRGANRWMSPADEKKAFKVDPRFEVNLFAGEVEFPELACPIQMRWDSRGRLWVSCSTTYPHVYPGNEPNDKIVILEDTNRDGRADKSTVFADNLHIPLSFVLGDGGVYVSEEPHLSFIKDTDGDGKADYRRKIFTGFGCEDSHHALHDFVWSPDGDIIFRESIFHHTQVETAYGPVRQQNSGWFRFEPRSHRLTPFGTYHSTNPWGVTFDDWGQHVASHPVYAQAFHSLDPVYPKQHPKPAGLRAYSGTCGQEFVDFKTFPEELQGGYIKARYKPTNRIEFHRWKETEFGYDEEYVSDIIFSSNLSFIPVDIRFGPRGAMYVADWYNPVKGHAQYSLRDERRDRHSGRIWRITAKGKKLQEPPRIHGASVAELIRILERPEYRYRYWAKREIRERDPGVVEKALDGWVAGLNANDPRLDHHRLEAVWTYRSIDKSRPELLRKLLGAGNQKARAAAVHQLRYWHGEFPDALKLLNRAANDDNSIVRMEAVIAASYLGSREALDSVMDVFQRPIGGHLAYAAGCALGSSTLARHTAGNKDYDISSLIKKARSVSRFREPEVNARQAQFDTQRDLKLVKISCKPEVMKFTVEQFAVKTGQPVKLVFTNPDATDHNLVIVQPDALSEVGMAANEMARDPKNANSDFIPGSKKALIIEATPMIGPTRASLVHVLRFKAPAKPGVYPYVCTFPGHWVIMNGIMVVARDLADVPAMLAARKPSQVKEWKLKDFAGASFKHDEKAVMRGMQAFMKARCDQCHAIAGHGINLGPDLSDVAKRHKGQKLLQQILEPSTEIGEKYASFQFILKSGKILTGVVARENSNVFAVITNLLSPKDVTRIRKKDILRKVPAKLSPMPRGLANTLSREEIIDLVISLEAGGYKLPGHLKHKHHKEK